MVAPKIADIRSGQSIIISVHNLYFFNVEDKVFVEILFFVCQSDRCSQILYDEHTFTRLSSQTNVVKKCCHFCTKPKK